MPQEMIQLKKRMPLEHAEIAYKDGYYVEGMQILHANLEISLRIFLIMIRRENNADSHEIEDILSEFNYTRCSKLLFILGLIDKNTYDKLHEFNKWKNFIIDKLLLPIFKENVPQISIDQYHRAFHLGVFLNEELTHILEHTQQHLETCE
jgi:predicted choloylglycine hydrolase